MNVLPLAINQLKIIYLTTIFLLIGFCIKAQDSTVKVKSPASAKTFFGQASFYSDKFNGRKTASGEIFSQSKMTCASNMLTLGTWVKITNLRNGKTAIVKVNDRLHPSMRRIVDLTRAAATQLGFVAAGLTRVKVEVLGKKRPK
jgi:rare lipoprotein A